MSKRVKKYSEETAKKSYRQLDDYW